MFLFSSEGVTARNYLHHGASPEEELIESTNSQSPRSACNVRCENMKEEKSGAAVAQPAAPVARRTGRLFAVRPKRAGSPAPDEKKQARCRAAATGVLTHQRRRL